MRAPHYAIALIALSAAAFTRADFVLQAPQAAIDAGSEITLELLETNPSEEPRPSAVPSNLPLIAYAAGNHNVSVIFRPAATALQPATLAAGGFRRIAVRGSLPPDFVGLVVLDASVLNAGRVAVELLPPSATARRGASTPDCAAQASSVGNPASEAGSHATPEAPPPRRDLGLSPHETIYFVVGGHSGINARFQLSFKFRPIGPSDDRIGGRGFWEDFYTAYTQTSLWDLHSLSKPFTDSSYRPAAFYHRYDTGLELLGGQLGFAGGFEHESNGKAGADSRSINILFARPTLRWGEADAWQFTASPKFYWYLDKSENDDIQRFRGYGDFLFTLEHPRSWKLAATFRAGTGGHGSVQVDASYPFSRINNLFPLGLVHGYLDFQFFEGWGESLLHYNERAETQFRVGFMALR